MALAAAAAEIENHVGAAGWDNPPALFALVRTARLARDDPAAAARLGLSPNPDADELIPVEQEQLPSGDLDEALARIAWPPSIDGCALSQEIVIIPPSVELPDDDTTLQAAADHPQRREARLVVAVLRDGASAAVLRLRGVAGEADDLLTGADLAPNLVAALLATFA